MRLSDQQTNFIKLIERSPNEGEGWRRVSPKLTPFFSRLADELPELYETKRVDDVFFVRLSKRGRVLKDYV